MKFRNQLDYEYFQFFRQKTASTLTGPFKSVLWTRVVLQACHEEPAIRALIASIGALELSRDTGLSGQKPDAHALYALKQYGKALGGVQRIARSGDLGALRKTLIASILIYCFENMHLGADTAISHMTSAMRCLRTELSRHSRSYRHLQSASPTPDLEDEVVAAFVRLDGAILGRPGAWGTTRELRFILDCDFSESDMPASFADTTEALNYLEQFGFVALPVLAEIGAAVAESQGAYVPVISPAKLRVCKQMSLNHQRWLAAYSPILNRATAARAEGRILIFEFTLLIKALGAAIAAQMVWAPMSEPEDHPELRRDMVKDSETAIDLARLISAEPGFSRGFVWDSSIVTSLFAVMMLAPTISLRREALDLMKSVRPRRENTWDSTSLVMIGEAALRDC